MAAGPGGLPRPRRRRSRRARPGPTRSPRGKSRRPAPPGASAAGSRPGPTCRADRPSPRRGGSRPGRRAGTRGFCRPPRIPRRRRGRRRRRRRGPGSWRALIVAWQRPHPPPPRRRLERIGFGSAGADFGLDGRPVQLEIGRPRGPAGDVQSFYAPALRRLLRPGGLPPASLAPGPAPVLDRRALRQARRGLRPGSRSGSGRHLPSPTPTSAAAADPGPAGPAADRGRRAGPRLRFSGSSTWSSPTGTAST